MHHHGKPRSSFVKECSSDSVSFSLCDCGLTVEGCVSHGFDPTGDGGFLTWHNTWLTVLLLWCYAMLCYSLKTALLFCIVVLEIQGFRKKVHCTVQQQQPRCLLKMYTCHAFTKTGLNIASAEVHCKCIHYIEFFKERC